MRARSLKPGLFRNEILGSADPLYTLLFECLWLMADREGRLEDIPLRICATAFPYRRRITERKTNQLLCWLDVNKFIKRYEVDGRRYIQVLEFSKHQHPHQNESPSQIPALSSLLHGAAPVLSTTQAPDQGSTQTGTASTNGASNRASSLTPSSLTPDSLYPSSPHSGADVNPARIARDPGSKGKLPEQEPDPNERIARIRAAYPPRAGRMDWDRAEHFCHVLIERQGQTWDSLEASVGRYAAYCEATSATSTQHVLMPGNFFGASDKPWSQPWTLPKPAESADPLITWHPEDETNQTPQEPIRASG